MNRYKLWILATLITFGFFYGFMWLSYFATDYLKQWLPQQEYQVSRADSLYAVLLPQLEKREKVMKLRTTTDQILVKLDDLREMADSLERKNSVANDAALYIQQNERADLDSLYIQFNESLEQPCATRFLANQNEEEFESIPNVSLVGFFIQWKAQILNCETQQLLEW